MVEPSLMNHSENCPAFGTQRPADIDLERPIEPRNRLSLRTCGQPIQAPVGASAYWPASQKTNQAAAAGVGSWGNEVLLNFV